MNSTGKKLVVVAIILLALLLFIGQASAGTVNNATTAGWTTANVSLNGSMINDDGTLSIITNHTINDGLVGYWGFNGNFGINAYNQNNANGTLNTTNKGTLVGMNTGLDNGSSGWNSSGRIGNALAFDGVNDYVSSNLNINTSNIGSITVWIIPNSVSQSFSRVFSAEISSNMGTRLGTNLQKVWTAYEGTSAYYYYAGTNILSIGVPTFISFVYNGTNVSTYINGVIQNVGSQPSGTNSKKTIAIGSIAYVNAGNFNGSIDEVRIYNRALSPEEISILYNTSLRAKAMPLILNQTASSGNVINRTRIVYTGQDALNNASIYARQNETTAWTLVQANATSNTWYPIINQFNAMDVGIQLNGNGSNTSFFTFLEWDEGITYISDVPSNLQNTTGNFWVRHSWQGSSQSYNISVNGTWYNGTTNLFYNNSGLSPHAWSNISVAGYNSSGGLSNLSSFISMNTQIPNNIPTFPALINKVIYSGSNLNFSVIGSDADGDSLTYSSNSTIGTFNATTGNFSYLAVDADSGTYYFYFSVDDAYGGTYQQTISIRVLSLIEVLLSRLDDLETKINALPTVDDVAAAGVIGFMGGMFGYAMVRKRFKR